MATSYKYQRRGEEHGPVTAQELKDLADRGQLSPDDLVWREGMGRWVPAARLRGLFAATAPPPQPAEAPGTRGGGAVTAKIRQILSEVAAVARATAAQARRLVGAGRDKVTKRRLHGAARAAQAELGERLHRAGVGDPGLRAELEAVNQQLLNQISAKEPTRAAADRRLDLQLRLAEPYLDQVPPPGAEDEHRRAVTARQALRAHLEGGARARVDLLPADRRERLRVAAGVGALLVLAVIALFVLTRHPTDSPADPTGVSPGAAAGGVGGGAAPA